MKKIKQIISSPISIRMLAIALNFISNIVINRSLGIALKGQYTTIQNYANFLQLLLNLGICYSYPIQIKEYGYTYARNILSSIIWLQALVYLIGSVIVLFIRPSIKTMAILGLFLVLICNSQIIFLALIDDIKKRNLYLLVSTILYIILNGIALLIFPGNLYVIVFFLILKHIFEIIICGKNFNYFSINIKSFNIKLLKDILKLGMPTALLAILISCNYNIDILMLNWMKSGDVQVGIYGVSFSLSNMMWFVPDAFKELIYNKTATSSNYRFVLKYIAINIAFCLCVCIGFAVAGKWFLGFIYGNEYIIAYNVSLTLFIGIIPMIAFKLIHPIYVNLGRSLSVVILLLIAVIVNIIVSYILIPQYGALGAALASIVSYSVCGGLFYIKFYWDYCRDVKNKYN